MKNVDERAIQGTRAFLDRQSKEIADIRVRLMIARNLTNTRRSLYRFLLVVNVVVAIAALLFALTSAQQTLLSLSLPNYERSIFLASDMLVVSLFLLAALCLAQGWRLYEQIRDDSAGYTAARHLEEIDDQVAGQLEAVQATAQNLESQLSKGAAIPLYQQQSPADELAVLNLFSQQQSEIVTPPSQILMRLLFAGNVLAWTVTSCAAFMGLFLQFVTKSQSWYWWDETAIIRARWAFPVAMLLLIALAIVVSVSQDWEDKPINPGSLLLFVLLVPLALLLGWGLVAAPHFLWEAIKFIFVAVIIILGLIFIVSLFSQ